MEKIKSKYLKEKKISKILKRKPVSKKPKGKNKLTKLKYQIITILFIVLYFFPGYT